MRRAELTRARAHDQPLSQRGSHDLRVVEDLVGHRYPAELRCARLIDLAITKLVLKVPVTLS
jgi:hypothetical protein